MLDKLNDDCLLRIIKYLSFPDQIKLWKANYNCSERLNANIRWVWRHQSIYQWDEITYCLNYDPEMIDEFLSCICDKLQTLKIEGLSLQRVQRWVKDEYPNMRELEYWMHRGEDSCAVLEIFAELFPALTSLTPHDEIHRLRTDKFTQLRRLDLTECQVVDLKESKSLEELIIDFGPDSIDFNFESLMCFPKLQKLSFKHHDGFEKLLDKIVFERRNYITKISFPSTVKFSNRLSQFNRFNLFMPIHNENIENSFTVEKLKTLVAKLPRLEQLDLIDCNCFSKEIDLWNTVSACPSLNLLNITLMTEGGFFESSSDHMNQALRDRSVPLTLNCYNDDGFDNLVSITEFKTQIHYLFEIVIMSCRS